jgi:hypothetical protein
MRLFRTLRNRRSHVGKLPAGRAEARQGKGGGGTFAQGCSCTVTATPKPGFQFVDWTENGKEVSTAEKYTFKLEADVVLLAHFEQ